MRPLVPLVAAALAGSIGVYATTHPASPLTRPAVHAPYVAADIVEYLLFSTGRVVADHPALDKHDVRTATVVSAPQARAAAESITGCIHSIDAAAGPALTAAFNAADPPRLDSALRRLDAAASRWLTAPYKQEDPCPPPPPPPSIPPDNGSAPGWFKVDNYLAWGYVGAGWDVAAVAASLGAAAALVGALLTLGVLVVFVALVLVPAFIWYEFAATPSELDRQIAIAKIVQALQS